jgi:hypothetical protein
MLATSRCERRAAKPCSFVFNAAAGRNDRDRGGKLAALIPQHHAKPVPQQHRDTTMADAGGAMVLPDIVGSLKAEGHEVLEKARAMAESAGAKAETVQVASRRPGGVAHHPAQKARRVRAWPPSRGASHAIDDILAGPAT